jgi:hypothetical protein
VSVSTCGGLIHGGELIFGGAYIRRFTVLVNKLEAFFSHATEVKFYKNVGEL